MSRTDCPTRCLSWHCACASLCIILRRVTASSSEAHKASQRRAGRQPPVLPDPTRRRASTASSCRRQGERARCALANFASLGLAAFSNPHTEPSPPQKKSRRRRWVRCSGQARWEACLEAAARVACRRRPPGTYYSCPRLRRSSTRCAPCSSLPDDGAGVLVWCRRRRRCHGAAETCPLVGLAPSALLRAPPARCRRRQRRQAQQAATQRSPLPRPRLQRCSHQRAAATADPQPSQPTTSPSWCC